MMSGLGVSWDIRGSYAPPCACQGGASENPALDAGELVDVFDSLGEALAVGELARRAGIPIGGELVAAVVETVEALAREPGETGAIGVVSRVASGVGSRVTRAASGAWAALRRNPELVSRLGSVAVKGSLLLGGYLLAGQWLSANERAKLEHVAGLRQIAGEAAEQMPPADVLRIIAGSNPFAEGADGGGWSFTSWLGLGAAAVLVLLAWRWLR